jgi:hypothetical protein
VSELVGRGLGNNGLMLIAYWIAAALLAFVYLFVGGTKIFRRKAALEASGMAWVHNVHPGIPKVVGVVEVLGALGVLLPPLVAGLPIILAPLAAIGLVLVQGVAIGVHMRMNDVKSLPVNVLLFLLALAVAFLGATVFVV